MNDLEIKVKKFGPKDIELSDGKKYTIVIKDEQKLTFKDRKDEAEKDLDVKIKEKDKDDKEYKDCKLKVKLDSSWYSDGVKVSSKAIAGNFTSLTLKEEKDIDPGVKGYRWPFWAVIVTLAIALAAFI